MTIEIDPPFGTYALPPAREAWRRKADGYKNTRIGWAFISRARKKALKGLEGPIDVAIADDINVRLYPDTNRCEKRAFAGVQVWDIRERLALKRAIESGDTSPFVFLDVGANVGLYSLYVSAYARRAGRDARIIAIEPGEETGRRLSDNIAASGADVHVIRSAVSDMPGSGHLGGGDDNRGEAQLTSRSDGTESVAIDTLPNIAASLGLSWIDAMKIDIEGHDFKALKAFFEQAPITLYPEMIILESDKDYSDDMIALCQAKNYHVELTTKNNAVMQKGDAI